MHSIVPPSPDAQEPDALDSLPIASLLRSRLASWFGDDRQSFLVSDLVPVVTQVVAEFQYNALEMARKADIAEDERDAALADVAILAAERDDLDTAVGTLTAEVVEWREMVKRLLAGGHLESLPSEGECCASGCCEVCSPRFDWGRNG